jgi:ABC-2 type transport system permease protein
VQTIVFGMVGPATALATDLTEGIVDRFRTLPMSRSSFLLGHMIAALAAMGMSIAVLSVSGVIVGWEIHADLLHAVAGYGLLIAFAFTMREASPAARLPPAGVPGIVGGRRPGSAPTAPRSR